jgi:cobalt-zinc-cadmium efflux system protein
MAHHHAHAHAHVHGHDHYDQAFALGVALNVVYIAVEASVGLWINSLALLADAGHNLSDVFGLLLAWGAHYLSRLRPTARRTYGWRSTSILAALSNGLVLMVAVGGIVWEAVGRFWSPTQVAGGAVMAVAGIGFVINLATALLFVKDRHGDLNIRGAYMHMAADAGVSLGVVLAGLGIQLTGALWIDPAASLVIAVVIFLGAWGLLRESVDMALQAVPNRIDPAKVETLLRELPGVVEVHDLHIWALGTTNIALTVHLVRPDEVDDDQLLAQAARALREQFGIDHSTIQLERDSSAADCRQAPPDVL